jgi:hypothetical protein
MRLEPLYRIRFIIYPESWAVGLDGGWQQLFFIAEDAVRVHNRGARTERRRAAADDSETTSSDGLA